MLADQLSLDVFQGCVCCRFFKKCIFIKDAGSVATNPIIQAYVKDKYGFYVHSLYIAQVRDKLGIKLHESANKVAQPKRKVSICPDYKEAAILDAFQHYGLI